MSQLITNEYPGPPAAVSGLPFSTDTTQRCNLGSAALLAEWLRRVRIWQIVVDIHSAAGPNANNGTSLMGQWTSGTPYGTPDPYFATERLLTLLIDPDFGPSSPEFIANGYSPQPFIFQSTATLGQFAVNPGFTFGFDVDGEGAQSNWFVQPSVSIDDGPGFSGLVTYDGIDAPHSITDISAATITIYGKPCNLYEATGFFPYTGSIVVTPYEWWPYAPTSGGLPVFDSTTGLQINPNVVID